jgi:hypothetical protein
LDIFRDLGASPDQARAEGESIISGDDVQELTNILSGKGIPAARGRE